MQTITGKPVKTITRDLFKRWVGALPTGNVAYMLEWHAQADRTFADCWHYLREDWSEIEVAIAFEEAVA